MGAGHAARDSAIRCCWGTVLTTWEPRRLFCIGRLQPRRIADLELFKWARIDSEGIKSPDPVESVFLAYSRT